MSAQEIDLDRYVGSRRLVLVFAPSTKSPPYQEQVRLFEAVADELEARDALFVHLLHDGESTVEGRLVRKQSGSALRDRFGVQVDDFLVVIIDQDGTEKKRYAAPVKIEALLSVLDAPAA